MRRPAGKKRLVVAALFAALLLAAGSGVFWLVFPPAGIPGRTATLNLPARIRLRLTEDARQTIHVFVDAYNAADWDTLYPLLSEEQPKGWLLPREELRAAMTQLDVDFPFGGRLDDDPSRVIARRVDGGVNSFFVWIPWLTRPSHQQQNPDSVPPGVWDSLGVTVFERDGQWRIGLESLVAFYNLVHGLEAHNDMIAHLSTRAVELGLREEPDTSVPEWRQRWEERQRREHPEVGVTPPP